MSEINWVDVDKELPNIHTAVLLKTDIYITAGFYNGTTQYPFTFLDNDQLDSYDTDENTVAVNAWAKGKVIQWAALPSM